MGIIENAFKRELGKNAGKTASNILFGDKWSTPYRRTDAAREKRAEAAMEQAEAKKIRQKAEADRIYQQIDQQHSNYLNSIDNAVIQNIDKVIAMQFDDTNPSYLCKQLQSLIVQLSVNSLEEQTDEDKIRAKYTKAVLEKSRQGLEILVAIDPLNKMIPYFDRKIYEPEYLLDKKHFKKVILILSYIFLVGGICLFFAIGMPLGIIPIAILWGIVVLCLKTAKSLKYKKRLNKFAYIEKLNMREKEIAIETARTKKAIEVEQAIENKEEFDAKFEQLKSERIYKKSVTISQEESEKSEIVKQTEALWIKYQNLHPIFEKGFQICENRGHKDILIMNLCTNDAKGIRYGGDRVYNFPTLIDFGSDWHVEMDMLVGQKFNLLSTSTYLTMFSCKEYQHVLINDIIRNPRTFNYVVDQITVTQNIIEDIITPKIIIVLDRELWAFFGRVKKLTWMGYTYRTVGEINGLEICEITGFSDASDRLAQDIRHQTNLVGTKVIFCGVMDYKRFPKAEQLLKLL